MWDESAITTAGASMLTQWIGGAVLNISGAAGGAGTVSAATLKDQTALKSQKDVGSIVSVTRETDHVLVRVQFHAAETGYTLQQIGIWAKIGNNGASTLLAIFQDANGVVIPTEAAGQEFLYTFYATLAISGEGSLTVNIDPLAYVSRATLDSELALKQDTIMVSGLLKSDGTGGIAAAVAGTDYIDSLSLEDVLEDYVATSDVGVEGGVAALDANGKVPAAQLPAMDYIPTSDKAVANGVASLDSSGKVPASQLRGGFIVSETAPSDTSLLWIDSHSVMRYYSNNAWHVIVPTWG